MDELKLACYAGARAIIDNKRLRGASFAYRDEDGEWHKLPYSDAACILMDAAHTLPKKARMDVHSSWDTSGKYMFADGRVAVRCKNCGCTITAEEYNKYVWNFCPVCGADMRGSENG